MPEPSEIRAALTAVLDGNAIGRGARRRALLTFLVEEELAGRGERLKAYTVGTMALDKPESFDPAKDSSVRVEIGRLRRALEVHYAGEGMEDPVRIGLPTGSYRPVFEAVERTAPTRGKQVRMALGVVLGSLAALVLAFWVGTRAATPMTGPAELQIVMAPADPGRPAAALEAAAADAVSRQGFVQLLERPRVADARRAGPADLRLTVNGTADTATVRLIHLASGEIVMIREVSLVGRPTGDAVKEAVAAALSASGEVLSGHAARRDAASLVVCLARVRDLWERPSPAARATAEDCLAGLDADHAAMAGAAVLRGSLALADALLGDAAALDVAVTQARQALSLDPDSGDALALRAVALAAQGHASAAAAAEAALRRNPYDPAVRGAALAVLAGQGRDVPQVAAPPLPAAIIGLARSAPDEVAAATGRLAGADNPLHRLAIAVAEGSRVDPPPQTRAMIERALPALRDRILAD